MQTNEMPTPLESTVPNIIFHNEPKLSEHGVDQKFNAMKVEFVPYIQKFVAEHGLFKNEAAIGIEFAHKGISSIIAIIDTPTNKYVLKIPRSRDLSAGEGQFFQAWERVGVAVPHVLETGEIHGMPFTLMDFIDAPTVDVASTQEERLDKKMYEEMGQTLRLMHSVSAEGYGSVVEGKPEFETVEEWLAGDDMKMRFDYIKEHGLLTGLEDVLEKSVDTIKKHAQGHDSTYCHADFGVANMFATSPITIFDSNPKFNSGYYDLGRIQFGQIAIANTSEVFEQMRSGYFEDAECADEVLAAYTFLAFCMKAWYWHQSGKVELLERARQYFFENN
jgi:tRNA A-37 threonylcarbamoyl transferase component Bud32